MRLSYEEFEQLKARVAAIDPLMVAAMAEVDRSLLAWAQTLSPLERLAAASRASAAFQRFRAEQAPKSLLSPKR